MKAIFKTMMLLATLTLGWGCSSDDKEEPDNGSDTPASKFAASEKPTWAVDMTANDAVPTWIAPDPSEFESNMFIMARLEEELAAHASDDDQMAVFIGSECRAWTQQRNVTSDGGVYYVLNIYGNSSDYQSTFSLRYYSVALHQLFILKGNETFASEHIYGFDEDFVPPLLTGSSKYPVQRKLTVTLPTKLPFNVSADDRVAVFVDGDCRGIGKAETPFTVYSIKSGETAQVRYYSAKKAGIYTINQSVTLKDKNQTLQIAF